MTKKVHKENGSRPAAPKCTVCMQTNAHVSINCIHKFCMKCIGKWVKRNQSCPLCRAQISQIKYGTRVKRIERRRKPQSIAQLPSPRLRFRITWKPVFLIGIPCMTSLIPNPFVLGSHLN